MRSMTRMLIATMAIAGLMGSTAGAVEPGYGPDSPSRKSIEERRSSDTMERGTATGGVTTDKEKSKDYKTGTTGSDTGGTTEKYQHKRIEKQRRIEKGSGTGGTTEKYEHKRVEKGTKGTGTGGSTDTYEYERGTTESGPAGTYEKRGTTKGTTGSGTGGTTGTYDDYIDR